MRDKIILQMLRRKIFWTRLFQHVSQAGIKHCRQIWSHFNGNIFLCNKYFTIYLIACLNEVRNSLSFTACSSTKTKMKTKTKTKAFVCSCMFWNKPVTNKPTILCNVILRAWFVRHRHYLGPTKDFCFRFRLRLGTWTLNSI